MTIKNKLTKEDNVIIDEIVKQFEQSESNEPVVKTVEVNGKTITYTVKEMSRDIDIKGKE